MNDVRRHAMTRTEATAHLVSQVETLPEVAYALPTLSDKSDVDMALMYLRHCLKRLEEEGTAKDD